MPRFRVFCYLSYCLVISEPAGSVVWCLTLTWRKFSVIIVSNISVPFYLLSLLFLLLLPLHVRYNFCSCPIVLECCFAFFSLFISISFFQVSINYILCLEDPFLNHVQSTNKCIQDILRFRCKSLEI